MTSLESSSVSSVRIADVVAITPVGLGALGTAMMLRARHSPISSVDTGCPGAPWSEVGACLVSNLPRDLFGHERRVALGVEALSRLPVSDGPPPSLVMAVADDDPRGEELAYTVLNGAPSRARHQGLGVIRAGHAGFGAAIEEARRRLTKGEERVMVGAIDSYHEPSRYSALGEDLALLSSGSPEGFVPGEAAVFAILERRSGPGVRVTSAMTLEMSEEERREESATTLTELLRAMASASREGDSFSWVLHDGNNEPHRSREWALAASRNQRCLPEEGLASGAQVLELGNIAGDFGAASMGVALTYAFVGFRAGFSPGREALIVGRAERGVRSAMLLRHELAREVSS
ncbi:MAG: hypothetical protein U0271_06645 [Polyangiaceae bacterium]